MLFVLLERISMKKTLCFSLVAIACLIGLALASPVGQVISNIYQTESAVSGSLPLVIGGDPGTIKQMSSPVAGQPLIFGIDVTNPNNVTVTGMIILNFTMAKIAVSDIAINPLNTPSGTASAENFGLYNNKTVTFELYTTEQENSPNFYFRPGLNGNITLLAIVYNAVGTYTMSMAVIR
jgi:hypothetical protein